jgi:hypothetical protein
MKNEKLKRIFNSIKPFVRGIVKSLPFGSVVIEASDNIKTEIALSKGSSPKRVAFDANGQIKRPHSWISIMFQLIFVGTIIYLLVSKQIDVNDFINFSKYFLGSDSEIAPSDSLTIN